MLKPKKKSMKDLLRNVLKSPKANQDVTRVLKRALWTKLKW